MCVKGAQAASLSGWHGIQGWVSINEQFYARDEFRYAERFGDDIVLCEVSVGT
jgi:hypothetical protein